MKVVPLTQGRVALVDDADYPLMMEYTWFANAPAGDGHWYAVNGKSEQSMHRMLIEASPGQKVDHRNGDGLDNRRANLRFATTAQNAQNSIGRSDRSGRFKGVMWEKERQKWVVRIKVDGVYRNLGRFDDDEEAAQVYNEAATEHFGEFARLNEARIRSGEMGQ